MNIIQLAQLLKPNVFNFYFKHFLLLARNRGKIVIKSFSLNLASTCSIKIDDNSKIKFGHKIRVCRGVDIEALDGATLSIGDHFFINKNSSIIARFGIDIGNDGMIGDNVLICDHNHDFSSVDLPFNLQGFVGKKIQIGNNVWIGTKVFIGPGVEIGDNVVIGAHTIVTKSIPSNSVVVGQTELIVRSLENISKKSL